METYIESQGKKPFDWFEALNQKEITQSDWCILLFLAKSWVTCACGNQCNIIPRDYFDGQPLDKELKNLGIFFSDAIRSRNKQIALNVLEAIEIRSGELIEEISCESK